MSALFRLLLSAALSAALAGADSSFAGHFFKATTTNPNGTDFMNRLDQARRMFSAGDTELQTLTGTYDQHAFGITEGAQWAGNFWTQNGYGVGFASLPFLPQPQLQWMQTAFLWWFDHQGDGGQTIGGMPDTPDGMLCDNGNPTGCNYMQCGAGRRQLLAERNESNLASGPPEIFPSKRRDSIDKWRREEDFTISTSAEELPTLDALGRADATDTPGLGHDWVIGGTLAGGVMQAEMLLATRNMTAIRKFLPQLARISKFMESRRVQDSSPLTPNTKGLFRAGNGADLLAPSFGGWPLPVGCVVNATFSNCTQRSMSYLTELTVTYSALLDRMVALENLAYPTPAEHICSHPNHDNPGPSSCRDIYAARRAVNEVAMQGMLETMTHNTTHTTTTADGVDVESPAADTLYLIRAMDPNGEKHGVYAPRPPCPVDEHCPLAARHGYFESAPNHDSIGLRVADDDLAASIYQSMISIEGLRPCAFTLPNFPDYDDSCGACDGGFGTWVSGGSWSTAEGRAILAHFRGGRLDLALASMSRIIDPYARLFKLDNPIAHQGCGPGMYSQMGSRGDTAGPLLDVDVFAIPAAFLHGLFAYQYFEDRMVLEPSLPHGVSSLTQEFPIRFGNLSLFFSLSGAAPPPSPPPPPAPAPAPANQTWSCELFGCECQKCADYYGIISGTGFGCAPLEAQHWWAKQGGKCGGATKASTGLCGGAGCKGHTPCACPKGQPGFTCTKCSNGAETCPAQVGPHNVPAAKYEWWQIPTSVTINSKPCAACLSNSSTTKASRKVLLPFDLLSAAAATEGSVAIHIGFGGAKAAEAAEAAATTTDDKTTEARQQQPFTGVDASRHWQQKQDAKSTVNLALVPAECMPPASVQANLTNSTAFSAAMANAGLGDRFEAAQAAAFREALNASVARCAGRASGAIPGMPKQPATWEKYKMSYVQSKAEGYFTDQYNRVWNGLSNLMIAYANPASGLASPTHQKIASLFRGEGVEHAEKLALRVEKSEVDAKVAALKSELDEAEAEAEVLDAALGAAKP